MDNKPLEPKKESKNRNSKEPVLTSYARYSAMAFQIGIIIALFTVGGYYVDNWLQLGFPVFLTIGLFLGIGLGIYSSIKDFIKKK